LVTKQYYSDKEDNSIQVHSKQPSFRDYIDDKSHLRSKLDEKIVILQDKVEEESFDRKSNKKLFERK